MLDSLLSKHGNKDLTAMIGVFAPKYENRTKVYLKFLRDRTGVKDSKKIKDFTKEEFEKLWKAIEIMEGFRKGEIKECTEKSKITGVRRDKKRTIIAYLIEPFGWVSKARGVELAGQGKIDAVIAHSRRGNLYLRTRPDKSAANNLDAMALLKVSSPSDQRREKFEKSLAKTNKKFGKTLKGLA